jgi:hypothetical protein
MLNVRQSKGADNSAVNEDLRIVADGLTSQGFDVRSPAWEDTQFLRVTNVRGMLCEVTISSTGRVFWECRRLCDGGGQHDAAQVVKMVTGILGSGVASSAEQPMKHPPGLTLKGRVGRALAERGMDVRLAVLFQDELSYEVYAEIEVTNPAQRERGRVLVADDGSIRWECHLRHLATRTGGVSPSEIAESVAMALAGRNT